MKPSKESLLAVLEFGLYIPAMVLMKTPRVVPSHGTVGILFGT